MGQDSDKYKNCMLIRQFLANVTNSVDDGYVYQQEEICYSIFKYEVIEGKYGKPMLWIGIYIAVASLICVLAMAADLFHGFRNKKLWFPSKYFTLNVASIMVITVAMKLPVDLNDSMPGWMDQFGKLGSMAFMTTMMANLMPSLSSMDDQQLFENAIGLVILVITIAVNVIIQIKTGVVDNIYITYICVVAILYLLIILTSLAVTTPASKRILEIKYQKAHKKASRDVDQQNTRLMSTVEELIQRVRRYSIMAGTCNPQFVMTTTPLCSVAGIICVFSTLAFFYYVVTTCRGSYRALLDFYSDYSWSMLVIFIIQSVGVVVGTIAPVFRCFAALSFKLSIKWCKKHAKIFEVERYWVQKLSEWKEIHLVFPLGGRTLKAIVHNLNKVVLNVCIGFQRVIVVSSKTITLVPIGFVIVGVYSVYCWKSFKAMLFAKSVDVSNRNVKHDIEQNVIDEDFGDYVLQLQDEMELGTRTLKSISNSVDRLIKKAEKQPPNNLLKLVEQSRGFEGVLNFDSDKIQPVVSAKLPNSWSLPVVTLTCIALSLPNICEDIVDSLCNGVCEGLSYTFRVEESLNNVGEGKNILRATLTLWDEVEVSCKWLGNTLQRNDFKEKTPMEILQWFSNKAQEIVVEIDKSNNEETNLENETRDKLIAANSMYRISQTIMLNNSYNDEDTREEQLFGVISDMIGSIVVACLANLPRVIAMKCHESAIEKREASVRVAAKLLGSTKKIIERLHGCELPSLDPDQMANIDEWREYLKQSIS